MKSFSQPDADLFTPDATEPTAALARTTHLGIGAHQDDLEFMALHAILECFQRDDRWFGGIICTDGAGSARTDTYAHHTDQAMKAVRQREQRNAAAIGQYSYVAQLAHPSAHVKQAQKRDALINELAKLIEVSEPDVLYTHNPFDKHTTHIAVLLAVLAAIQLTPPAKRPSQLFGCEVWRGLDWLPDERKVVHDVSSHPNLAAALNGVFDSQIAGGKRYDLAVEGRRLANATFYDSHHTDASTHLAYAIDLTPLIGNEAELPSFMNEYLEHFTRTIHANLNELL